MSCMWFPATLQAHCDTSFVARGCSTVFYQDAESSATSTICTSVDILTISLHSLICFSLYYHSTIPHSLSVENHPDTFPLTCTHALLSVGYNEPPGYCSCISHYLSLQSFLDVSLLLSRAFLLSCRIIMIWSMQLLLLHLQHLNYF